MDKNFGVSENVSNFALYSLTQKTMATAIKAIPTLYGEEAIRFKERAEKVERNYKAQPKIDWNKNPEVIAVRKMWAEMER